MRAGRKSAAAFLVFLGAFASTLPVQAGNSSQADRSFWDLILPLGGPENARDVGGAFDAAAGLAAPFKKFLFVSRYEPDLDQVLDLIMLNSTSLDLDNLYSSPDIPWQAQPNGRKLFRFGGRIEPQDYHFQFTSNGSPLERFGDTWAEFSIRPASHSKYKHVYALAYQQSWFMGPLGTQVLNEINRTWLELLDVSALASVSSHPGLGTADASTARVLPAGADLDREAAEKIIRDRFTSSFPALTREASGLIRIDSVVEPIPSADGQGPLTRIQFLAHFDDRALKRDYRHFRKAHQALSASHLRMRVVDGQGRNVYTVRAGGGSMGVTLVTRKGLLFPTDPKDGSPSLAGERLDQLLAGPHHVEIDNWIVIFGMKFGMDHMGFNVTRTDNRRRGVLADVPRPILPPIIKQIFSPFIRSYYEVIYDGDEGRGMSFEGAFQPTDGATPGSVLTHRYELPLQNSSLLSFFLKAGNQFRRSLPYEARVEFLTIVDRLSKALASDFDRARACFSPPSPLTASALPVSTDPPCHSLPQPARR